MADDQREIDTKKREKAMPLVYLTVLIDMLGLTLTIPILVLLTLHIIGEPASCCPVKESKCINGNVDYYSTTGEDDDIPQSCIDGRLENTSVVGLVNTMYAVGTFISTFWMPKVSDKFGRRYAFLLSLGGSASGFLFFALSQSFWALLLARLWAGLFGGSMVVANAYIADVYKPKERGPKFAQLGATMMLALLIGPLSGAGLVNLFGGSLRAPLIAATSMCVIAFGFASYYIVEPKNMYIAIPTQDSEEDKLIPRDEAASATSATSADASGVELGALDKKDKPIGEAELHPRIDNYNPWKSMFNCAIGCQTFCAQLSFNGLTSCIAVLLMAEKYGFVSSDGSVDEARMSLQIGLNTILISLSAMPTMIIFFPKLLAKFGILLVGVGGTCCFGACIFSLPFTPNIDVLMVVMVLIGISNGLQMNVSTIALSSNAPKAHIAETLAVGSTCDAMAAIVGPFMTQLFLVNLEAPFVLAGCAAWFGASMLILIKLFCDESSKGSTDAPKEERARRVSTIMGETGFNLAMLEEAELDELEAEARAFAPRAPRLGRPVFDPKTIAAAIFPNQEAGKDYDEVFAEDVATYMSALHATWEKQNHLQVLETRADVKVLDDLASKKAKGEIEDGVYQEKRSDELQKQRIHRRALTVHTELIKNSHPYLPDRGDWDNINPEFLEAIGQLLEATGHDDWAKAIPGFASGELSAKHLVPH